MTHELKIQVNSDLQNISTSINNTNPTQDDEENAGQENPQGQLKFQLDIDEDSDEEETSEKK